MQKQFGIGVNLDRCTVCFAYVVARKEQNKLPEVTSG